MPNPAQRAYRIIHERIVSAAYPPGYHLKEQDLSRAIGVSRTPVREALRRLSSEGLVAFSRNQGSFVESFTAEDVDEVFHLRAMLESHGVVQAAARITPDGLKTLDRLNAELEALRGRPRDGAYIKGFSRINAEFHRVILAAAGSRRLATMLGPVMDLPLILMKHYNWRAVVDLDRSCRQHRELTEALRARDGAWAASLMRAHILGARGDPAAFPKGIVLGRKPPSGGGRPGQGVSKTA